MEYLNVEIVERDIIENVCKEIIIVHFVSLKVLILYRRLGNSCFVGF